LRIISLCLLIEQKGSNPFEVEVQEILGLLRKYLPKWQVLEDFALDAETLNKISSIVQLQGNWIKHRTSTLFVDPLLIELKIKMVEASVLADIFRKVWHPIIEMDRLTPRRISEAIEYWNRLLPLDERYLKLPEPTNNLGLTSLEELINSRMMSEEGFNELMQELWKELIDQAAEAEKGQVPYWDFIYASSYDETVLRAYLTSFLLTYGFATMEIDRINEMSFLIPCDEPKETSVKEQMISIPISIDYSQWKKMGENR
jgi:hypothetical protein